MSGNLSTVEQQPVRGGSGEPAACADSVRTLTFRRSNEFQAELRRRIDEFFQSTGRRRRDCPQLYVKAAVILTVFGLSYGLLVFAALSWWQALGLAAAVGLSTAAIGFNLMHDGGHGAASRHRSVNKALALTLDLIGGSSYLWHWKHGVIHHTYVNITGHDTDIEVSGIGRLTPHQPLRSFQRWQHWYMWPLYGVMAIKWHFYDDFHDIVTGRIGTHRIPRPKGWELLFLIVGKAAFFTLAFGVPLLLHPLWAVAVYYVATAFVLGMALSIVFQLAHGVEEAAFPMPSADTGQMEHAWAVHQVETGVDFSRRSRVVTWLLGGLNFQIEHHLFPRICHVNYPAMSKLVEDTCREFQVRYQVHKSLWAGIGSHYRWLRRMGAPA
jgi:linoleoyl-CoA desaturase